MNNDIITPSEPQNNNPNLQSDNQPIPTPQTDSISESIQLNSSVSQTEYPSTAPETQPSPQPETQPQSQVVSAQEPQVMTAQPTSTTPPTQSQPIVSPYQPEAMPNSTINPKKNKKLPIILASVGAFLLLALGGGAFAYTKYQSPEKVLLDAYQSFVAAETVDIKTKTDINYSLSQTGQNISINHLALDLRAKGKAATGAGEALVSISVNGKDYELKGRGLISEKGDVYFRIDELTKALVNFFDTFGEDGKAMIDNLRPTLEKLDNKWVVITKDEMKADTENEGYQSFVCMHDAYLKLVNDESYGKAELDSYKKNQFIKIEETLPEQNGNLRYKLGIDQKKYDNFVKEIDSHPASKRFNDCNKSDSEENTAIDKQTDDTKITATITVSKWKHELKSFIFETETKADSSNPIFNKDLKTKTTLTPTFNTAINLDAPKDATPYKQWIKDLEEAGQSTGLTPNISEI